MRVLQLILRRKWFDMILSGEKLEEYREIKPYWTSRFEGKHFDVVRFRNGYHDTDPSFDIELESIKSGIGNLVWGAPANKVYILKLGKIRRYPGLVRMPGPTLKQRFA